RQPRSPAGYLCPHCGKPGPWATADQLAEFERKQTARSEYEHLISQIVANPDEAESLVPHLRDIALNGNLSATDVRALASPALRQLASRFLADDVLSVQEELLLYGIADGLGIDLRTPEGSFGDLSLHMWIGRINDGRLPAIQSSHLLETDEVEHLDVPATLLR